MIGEAMDSVWIVEGLDCCGGECDTIEGFVETQEEAEAIAKALSNDANEEKERWNEHCVNCGIMCCGFKSKEEADEELEDIKKRATCDCAKLKVSEETPGEYYVTCDSYASISQCDYTYTTREISKLKLSEILKEKQKEGRQVIC